MVNDIIENNFKNHPPKNMTTRTQTLSLERQKHAS